MSALQTKQTKNLKQCGKWNIDSVETVFQQQTNTKYKQAEGRIVQCVTLTARIKIYLTLMDHEADVSINTNAARGPTSINLAAAPINSPV